MITLTLPLKRMSESRRCSAAESTSAARILRRNSVNPASSIPRDTSHMRPSFSPQAPQLYRCADAIAHSFRQSRQSCKTGDSLVAVRLARTVTKIEVTYRRILIVDYGGKPQKRRIVHPLHIY